jgi:hypothetical protein
MNPSPKLLGMVNDWADAYIKSVDLPDKIATLALSEGLTQKEIRDLVVTALSRRGLSDRRIRQVLPAELKYLSKVRENNGIFAAQSAANPDADFEEPPANVPTTTPDTIILKPKTEAEMAEEEYQKDSQAELEQIGKRAEVQQLIDNHILIPEQIEEWVDARHTKMPMFRMPKNIEITKGAYHAKLSPIQAAIQLKQFGNTRVLLEIGWKIIE